MKSNYNLQSYSIWWFSTLYMFKHHSKCTAWNRVGRWGDGKSEDMESWIRKLKSWIKISIHKKCNNYRAGCFQCIKFWCVVRINMSWQHIEILKQCFLVLSFYLFAIYLSATHFTLNLKLKFSLISSKFKQWFFFFWWSQFSTNDGRSLLHFICIRWNHFVRLNKLNFIPQWLIHTYCIIIMRSDCLWNSFIINNEANGPLAYLLMAATMLIHNNKIFHTSNTMSTQLFIFLWYLNVAVNPGQKLLCK